MTEWIEVASFDALVPATAVRVDATGADGTPYRVALVRVGDDLYAVDDRCSHGEVSLSEGTVYDDECQLECIKHGSLFSLTTGAALTLPATRPIPVYEVRRDGDTVFLGVPGTVVGSSVGSRPHDVPTDVPPADEPQSGV